MLPPHARDGQTAPCVWCRSDSTWLRTYTAASFSSCWEELHCCPAHRSQRLPLTISMMTQEWVSLLQWNQQSAARERGAYCDYVIISCLYCMLYIILILSLHYRYTLDCCEFLRLCYKSITLWLWILKCTHSSWCHPFTKDWPRDLATP